MHVLKYFRRAVRALTLDLSDSGTTATSYGNNIILYLFCKWQARFNHDSRLRLYFFSFTDL